ncbi:MAG: hypothetical protein LUM44_18690 [Pyrinomonadaceae bacterium]|nr:hypothetical protein [Pyrinomonadaceae bacterium]
MLIRSDQLDAEDFPLAYQLTICFMCRDSPTVKNSLENCPDKNQRKLIAEMISEAVKVLEGNLLILRVRKKKIKLIIDASVSVEKLFNLTTLSIIEILKKSHRFSEQINLWEPEKDIKNLMSCHEIEKAVRNIKGEKEIALGKSL